MIETLDRPLDKNAMKLISSTSSVGRALVAPPDHEKARTAALREAFDKMARAGCWGELASGASPGWRRLGWELNEVRSIK